jgi:hypothetical protein
MLSRSAVTYKLNPRSNNLAVIHFQDLLFSRTFGAIKRGNLGESIFLDEKKLRGVFIFTNHAFWISYAQKVGLWRAYPCTRLQVEAKRREYCA